MNSKKTIVIFLLGIIVLLCAHFYLSYKGTSGKFAKRTTLVSSDMNGADAMIIERSQGRSVELRREDETWRIVSPYVAKAETESVLRILDALTLRKIIETYTEGEINKVGKTRADFSLSNARIKIHLSKAGRTQTVSLGRRTPAGDGVFAAVDGDESIYVVEPAIADYADVAEEDLRLKDLILRDPGTITTFDLKRPNGVMMRFAKVNGQWRILADREGEADSLASSAKIDELLGALCKTTAKGFVWPVGATNETTRVTPPLLAGYGLDSESAVTMTIYESGKAVGQIGFGNDAGGGLVYALAQDGKAIVTVDGRVKDFAMRGDFLDLRIFPYRSSRVSRIFVSDKGVDYLLAKSGAGDWMLDSPISASADRAQVEDLLSRILGATVDDRDEEGVSVSLATNTPAVKVSRSVILSGFSLSSLRSRDIAQFDIADIRRLLATQTDSNGSKTSAVVYDRDRRTWIVESSSAGATVQRDSVADILRELRLLKAVRVVDLKVSDDELYKYGLDRPSYTLSADFFMEKSIRRNIFIGNKTDGGYYATTGAAFDAVFVISEDTYNKLVSPLLTE